MKKFYVPEIGDEITLTEDWTFQLHSEYRNIIFGHFLGYNNYYSGWVNQSDTKSLETLQSFKYREDCESQDDYMKRHKEWQLEWQLECEKFRLDVIEVTIPKGCILKIDRIYIRKGNKDYSSITFNVKNMGQAITSMSRWNDKKNHEKIF